MSSRYINSAVLKASDRDEPAHYSTFDIPSYLKGYDDVTGKIRFGIGYVEHVIVQGERLDHLAMRYYGDTSLWWVIAIFNGIRNPGDMQSLTKLLIPIEYGDVLSRLGLR